jgi:hypothetical protein
MKSNEAISCWGTETAAIKSLMDKTALFIGHFSSIVRLYSVLSIVNKARFSEDGFCPYFPFLSPCPFWASLVPAVTGF